MNSVKQLVYISIFLMISASAYAQSSSILRFAVADESGQPIVGANVLLFEDDEEDYIDYGVTSRDGFVEFRNLEKGRYRIKISYVGFQTYEEFYEVGRDETEVNRLTMLARVGEMEELEVVGEGKNTGNAGITRVRAEDIGRVPSASLEGDLMAYIETMPGVISTGDQGGDLYIRGGTPAQNLVLVDNIPLVKPFHISNLFSAFPEKAVNNVSIMAGGFDNRYMNSTSAVIDVNLKTANLNNMGGSASFSPYMSSVFIETPIREGASSLFISGRKSTIKEFSGYLGTEKQDMDFYDIIARYTLQGAEFNCSVSGIFTGDEGQINQSRNVRLGWSNKGVGLRCFGFDETFDHPFEISAGYSEFVNRENPLNGLKSEASVNQGYLRVDLQEEVSDLTLDYGLNVWYQSFDAQSNERFASYNEGLDFITSIIQLYVKTKWQPISELIVEPGIGTQITMNYSSGLEPRLRMQYNPFQNNSTEFSFATGLYSQTMEGITDPRDAGSTFTIYSPTRAGEPLPTSFHNILSWKNRFGRHWTTNIEAYYKKHNNIPVPRWTQQVGIETETVLADGDSYGLDVRLEFSSNNFYGLIGYGLGKVEYAAKGDELTTWMNDEMISYSPAHDQTHKINTLLSYQVQGFDLSMNWEFGSGLPFTQIYATDMRLNVPYSNPITDPGQAAGYYDTPYSSRLPVYHRLDVSLKRFFDITDKVSVGAEIGAINAYNQENVFYLDVVEYEVVYQSRLLPYLSFSVNFNQ